VGRGALLLLSASAVPIGSTVVLIHSFLNTQEVTNTLRTIGAKACMETILFLCVYGGESDTDFTPINHFISNVWPRQRW
jgi:hypothetical protein